jgi:hypothetical protein
MSNFSSGHTAVPLEIRNSSPLSGFPYLLLTFGTDHAQKTQPLCCCVISPHRKHSFLRCCVTSLHLLGSVFTEPLPRNVLHNPVVLLLLIGPCLRSRCQAMRWSNPLKYCVLVVDIDGVTTKGGVIWAKHVEHARK